jgi:hypothetical protein
MGPIDFAKVRVRAGWAGNRVFHEIRGGFFMKTDALSGKNGNCWKKYLIHILST